MKFQKIKYRNFGPFKGVELSLADRGLLLAQGRNEVSTSADSNGSGKSFLLEGLIWGLFGETMRGIKGDDVVNVETKKNCSVQLTIVHEGQEIDIIRYRKAKKGGFVTPDGIDTHTGAGLLLYIDGVDMTACTVKETEDSIRNLLGLDKQTFVRSVYFDGSEIAAFPTLTDREIKEVFERVLGLEDLQKVAEVVKRRKSAKAAEVAGLDSQVGFERANVSAAEMEIIHSGDRMAGFDAETAAAVSEREGHLATTIAMLPADTFDAEIEALDVEGKALAEELKPFAGLDDLVAGNSAKRSELASKVGGVAGQAQALRLRLSNLDKEQALDPETFRAWVENDHQRRSSVAKKYSALQMRDNAEAQIGKPCGECGRVYERHQLSEMIEHANKTYVDLDAEIAQLTERDAEFRAASAKATDELAARLNAEAAALYAEETAINAEIAAVDEKAAKFAKLNGMRQEALQKLRGLPARVDAVEARRSAYRASAASV